MKWKKNKSQGCREFTYRLGDLCLFYRESSKSNQFFILNYGDEENPSDWTDYSIAMPKDFFSTSEFIEIVNACIDKLNNKKGFNIEHIKKPGN